MLIRTQGLVSNFVHYHICMVLILRIGKFLCNNYRQALSFMAGIPALQETIAKLNIPSVKCFPQWLSEELAYLKSQEQVPEGETLEMEYYSRLVAYYRIEYIWYYLLNCSY